MTKTAFQKNIIWLRICTAALLLSILSLFLFSFTVTTKITNDIWNELGITQQQGTEKIRNSFLNNYLDYYGIRNAKNIAVNNRAAIAKDILLYTKQYISSNAFKEEYKKLREQTKPIKQQTTILTKEDIRKDMISQLQKSIQEAETNMKKLTPDIQKSLAPVIDMQKKNLQNYSKPDNEIIEMMYQQQFYIQKSKEEQYAEDLKKWEENYPADYKIVIKARLEKYLSIAAAVDFNAALTEKYNRKVFTNPSFESKSNDWKIIYRAGKEVYNAIKPLTETWIKEL